MAFSRFFPCTVALCIVACAAPKAELTACDTRLDGAGRDAPFESPIMAGRPGSNQEEQNNGSPPLDAAVSKQDSEAGEALPEFEVEVSRPFTDTVYMSEQGSTFCVALSARGENMTFTFPAARIYGFKGEPAFVRTDSLTGTVFGSGTVREEARTIFETGSVVASEDEIVYPNLAGQKVAVLKNTTRRICIFVQVTAWSFTPTDFYGQRFVFQMDPLTEESVTFTDTEEPVPRAQIIAPDSIEGYPFYVVHRDAAAHLERYQGVLSVARDITSPSGGDIVLESPPVDALALVFSATPSGSCVRSVVITDTGDGDARDITSVLLTTAPQDGGPATAVASGTLGDDNRWEIGFPPGEGFLFCLNGGQHATYSVAVAVSKDAVSGSTHQFGIELPAEDMVVVQGATAGADPVRGEVFTVAEP